MIRAGGRAGFTLVEMLITLTVAGVLGAAILSLVLGQNRFYGQSDDTIYAQQSLRAAMDLMASELRMASARDLIVAEADSVRIRFDLERAVACASAGGNAVDIYVYDVVQNANLPADFRGVAYSGPYEATWRYPSSEPFTPNRDAALGAARNACESSGTPPGHALQRFHRVTGWNAAFAQAPEPGSLLRFYGALTYRFGPSSFGDGLAVWRNNQELVSPFEDGASFSYVLDGGLVLPSVPSTDLLDVRAIRIQVVAQPDGANRYDVNRAISYDVPLRN